MYLSKKKKKALIRTALCKGRKRDASGHGQNTTIKRLIKLGNSLKKHVVDILPNPKQT